MKAFWNERYAANETVYGWAPNQFFKDFIDTHAPGHILLPGEGEGRNALYAAKKGWMVDAFDFSEAARNKADALAEEAGLLIHYELKDIATYEAHKLYDAVALIYVHLPEPLRSSFHAAVAESLQPGGFLVLEAFTPQQLQNNSGGPRDEALLYTASAITPDFSPLQILHCEEKEIELGEGDFHNGKASVLRLIAQKL